MTEEDICYWYQASRNHRETELTRGEGLEGTMGYETMGCYKCDGLDLACKNYTILEKKNG